MIRTDQKIIAKYIGKNNLFGLCTNDTYEILISLGTDKVVGYDVDIINNITKDEDVNGFTRYSNEKSLRNYWEIEDED